MVSASNIELLPFLIGLALSALLIFLLIQIRKLRQSLKNSSSRRQVNKTITKKEELDRLLRKYILREAQNSHLASFLFPLNKVCVDLKLFSRPFYSDPESQVESEILPFKTVPYLPDFPELIADLPIPTITLSQALSGSSRISVAGNLGCGKTTMLAKFTSQILESSESTKNYNHYLPLFVNIKTLLSDQDASSDLISRIAGSLASSLSGVDSSALNLLIHSYLEGNRLLLLLDGFDEVDPDDIEKVTVLLSDVFKNNPGVLTVTTIGPYYSGHLASLNFTVLPIEPLNQVYRTSLKTKWTEAIENIPPQDDMENKWGKTEICQLWEEQDNRYEAVFEYTLRIWSHFEIHQYDSMVNPLEAYILRILSTDLSIHTLSAFAVELYKTSSESSFSRSLKDMIKSDATFQSLSDSQEPVSTNPSKQETKTTVLQLSSLEDRIIQKLLRLNLIRFLGGNLFFSNPSVFSYFLSRSQTLSSAPGWKDLLKKPLLNQAYLFFTIPEPHLENWISNPEPILFRNAILAVRHFISTPNSLENRSLILKKIFSYIKDDTISLNVRIKLFSVFLFKDLNTLPQLFTILQSDASPSLRSLAAFYFSYLKNTQTAAHLTHLLEDPALKVSQLACLSFFKIWDAASQKVIIDSMFHGNDLLKQFIAEHLACKLPEGPEILKELSEVEDIRCRKAAVSGLRLLNEDWAVERISSMSVNDSQWIVRDAASNTIQKPYKKEIYIPINVCAPTQSAWLVKYASETGHGISEYELPTGLLLDILHSGSYEEKMTALRYLSGSRDPKIVNQLISLTRTENTIREACLFSLSQLAQ